MLEPTTNLLIKYNPEYTCLLVGAKTDCWTRGYLRRARRQRASHSFSTPALLARRRPVPLPGQPADRRRQGRTGRQAGLRFAARSSPRTGRCASWSPTPAWAPAWTSGPTPASASRATPTTSRSPGRCPNRRASATCSAGLRPDRSRIPGAPPYGAPLYAPDGTPLWPGLPPAPPPGRAAGSRPAAAGLGAVRGAGPRADAADTAATVPLPAGGRRRHRDRPTPIRHREVTRHERQPAQAPSGVLAIFLVVCLLGVFALFAVFGQLRFGEKHRPTRPSSPT